ncbi:MAG: hypothetical protein IJM44_00675 [Ruminococcus sp.]|nr:hypothetical protein [Ruminococcus sp.]
MTGTGTRSDPFIIMSAADMYAMSTAGGADVYCKLGADIDLNGTQYADDFTPFPLNCAAFDGNGHTIRNVYKAAPGGTAALFEVMTSAVALSGISMENIMLNAPLPNLFMSQTSGAAVTISRCRFAMDITATSSATNASGDTKCILHDGNTSVNVQLSSFIIRAHMLKYQPFMSGGTLASSMFRISLQYLQTRDGTEGALSAFLMNVNMTDCGFLGTVKLLTSTSGAIFYFASGGEHTNSYSAVVFNSMKYVYWDAYIRSTCIWRYSDNTNITLRNDKGTSGYILQFEISSMKNASILRNYGFNCEG